METFIHNGKVARFISSMLYYDGEYIAEFKGLKEAREHLEALDMALDLEEQFKVVVYDKPLLDSVITLALNESGEIKPTASIVENFKILVNERKFFPSNTLLNLRETYNPSDVYGKIDYHLNDGSTVLIDIETNRQLNTIMDLKDSADLLLFMTANPTNFSRCVGDLLEDL
jgi:hypothetical protein